MTLADYRHYYTYYRNRNGGNRRPELTRAQVLANWRALGNAQAKQDAVNQIRNAQAAQAGFLANILLAQQQAHAQVQLQQNAHAQLFQQAQQNHFAQLIHPGQQPQAHQPQAQQQAQAPTAVSIDRGVSPVGCTVGPRTRVNAGFEESEVEKEDHVEVLLKANIASDPDGRWEGGWIFRGGKNTTGIWVRMNNEGRVNDRVVVKDTYASDREWMDVRRWDLDRRGGGWQPTEYAIQHRLRRSPDNHHFAGVRQCEVYEGRKMYRLYTDYCQHGNGYQMIRTHSANQEQIPEPMLWNIFEGLTETAIVMQQGALRQATGEQDWLEVIHRDLRPENVFFSEPNENRYPDYVRPVLGDYGAAMQTSGQDVFNPDWYCEQEDPSDSRAAIGAPGYQAPETQPACDLGDNRKILSHTNVWGIGVTMISFMDLECFDGGEVNFNEPESREPRAATEKAMGFYSEQLQELVARCTRYKPAERVDVFTLRSEILEHTSTGGGLANGMRNAKGTPTRPEQPWKVEPSQDTYALEMTSGQLPLKPTRLSKRPGDPDLDHTGVGPDDQASEHDEDGEVNDGLVNPREKKRPKTGGGTGGLSQQRTPSKGVCGFDFANALG